MKHNTEKRVITCLLVASVISTFIDISFAIYLAVMCNVVTNYFGHYTSRYIDG